jgi:hypothetical protein
MSCPLTLSFAVPIDVSTCDTPSLRLSEVELLYSYPSLAGITTKESDVKQEARGLISATFVSGVTQDVCDETHTKIHEGRKVLIVKGSLGGTEFAFYSVTTRRGLMKINRMMLFLCFAWVPVLVVLSIGAEISACDDTAIDRDVQSMNTQLEDRFTPTRYMYLSDVLGQEVPMVHGAFQRTEAGTESDSSGSVHELIVTAHDQGDLDGDGVDEAILLVEESVCGGVDCQVVRHLDIWSHRGEGVARVGRIPVSKEFELESIGVQIQGGDIRLTMVDTDANGELREILERWDFNRHAPQLVETRIGDYVEDRDGGC